MRNLLLVLVLLVSIGAFSQQPKPKQLKFKTITISSKQNGLDEWVDWGEGSKDASIVIDDKKIRVHAENIEIYSIVKTEYGEFHVIDKNNRKSIFVLVDVGSLKFVLLQYYLTSTVKYDLRFDL